MRLSKGRFKLNATVYSILAVLLLYMGGYAALYRVSGREMVARAAQASLQGTGRRLEFGDNIERRLLPRPTVILHQVRLSEADGRSEALRAESMSIGFGWQSLIDTPQIDKLTVSDADIRLSAGADGSWNFADLLARPASPDDVYVRRVQISNSRASVSAAGRTLRFDNIQFSLTRNGTLPAPYTLYATVENPAWSRLAVQASGNAVVGRGALLLPDALVEFSGEENARSFSGSLKGSLSWQDRQWQLKNSRFAFASNRYNSTLTISADKLSAKDGEGSLNGINAVLTAYDPERAYNAGFTAARARWQDSTLSSSEMAVRLSIRPHGQDSIDIGLEGGGSWHPTDGLRLPAFKLTSRQDAAAGTRFASEWDGRFSAAAPDRWRLDARGMLDRQSVRLSVGRREGQIDGSAELAKFNAANYLDILKNSSAPTYPDWFGGGLKLKLALTLGELELPGLEIHNIAATLNADQNQTVFSPLSGELYNGRSSGSFHIINDTPLRYRLQQKAEGVQILPLLQDLLGSSTLSGKGHAEFDLTGTGTGREELLSSLSGSLKLHVQDGLWHGINVSELIKSVFTDNVLPGSSDTRRTPFSEFILESKISGGISENILRSTFTTPAAAMTGQGETNLATGQIREDITIIGQDQTNPLPLRLSGNIERPSVTLDYQRITSGLATSEEKKKAVSETLKQQWEWLKK